jgi:cytosine/adenosine deaminase-related metal-dependent hydrolase
MLITGARVALDSSTAHRSNLWLKHGLVSFAPIRSAGAVTLDLDGFIILPGLINAHDHLELNLFPRLGSGPYPNASAWAKDIYRPGEPPVKQHLQLSKELRLRWGGIKNLLSGVTTVAHHNAFHPVFLEPSFPVRVIKRYGWAHSLQFSPDWEARLRSTPADYPFIIHAAEGTDEAASCELRTLYDAGALNESTVLVHGVAIAPSDVPILQRTKTSLVWCPTSNRFTLGRSIHPAVLNADIPIALGSDSAMTADGDLLDDLRVAQRTLDADRLYRMVTTEPARIFKLPLGFGEICDGGVADLLVMRDTGQTPAATLAESYPELVFVGGRTKLVSHKVASRCPPSIVNSLQPLKVQGRGQYLIDHDVSTLLRDTERALQGSPRLAGKAIAA